MRKYRYTKGIVLLGLIALIGLSSCQVVNKYKTPELSSEDLYGEMTSSDTTTIANIPWNEYFSDPILCDLIKEGIDNNLNLQMAYTRVQQAEASLSMARAAYFPSFAIAGQVNQSRNSMGANGKDVLGYHSTNYTLGVSASWELDIWGKLNRQSRAQYAQFLSSHAYKNLIQTSIVANIATSYYSLLALDEKLIITKETIKLMEENVETMKSLKESGMLTEAAVSQSKALLYGTQTSLKTLESNIRQLESTICLLLGKTTVEVPRSSIYTQDYPQTLEYGIPAQMLAKRPDVQQAELAFRTAFEMTNVAQASFYPSITLSSGTVGFGTANTLSNFFKPENIFASIIGGLTQPLFAKKQLIGNLKIAKAQQQEALLSFEQTVLSAGKEVTDILYSYDLSLKNNSVRDQQIEACKASVYMTKELLLNTDINYIEVITAEQNLLSAQLSKVDDRLEQLTYSVNLYRALGGGVK